MLVGSSVANRPIKLSVEAEALASLVRALSAISLMFIIMVTPWAILQVMMKKFTVTNRPKSFNSNKRGCLRTITFDNADKNICRLSLPSPWTSHPPPSTSPSTSSSLVSISAVPSSSGSWTPACEGLWTSRFMSWWETALHNLSLLSPCHGQTQTINLLIISLL